MIRYLILIIFGCSCAANAEENSSTIDRSGKWDVNGPLGASSQLEFTTDSGTWMNLDLHPDGERIIFDMLGDLYLVAADGGEAIRLTDGAAHDFQPRFSPDGKQVLFTSDRGSIKNIWVADFEGESLSGYRQVNEQNKNGFVGGNWTSDGEWILARKRVTDVSSIGVSELWLFHRDGGSGVKLIADKAEVESFSTSPDGRYIYYGASGPFSYGQNPHARVWSVNRYDRITEEKRPVSNGNGSSASPLVSPDGKTIAFVRRVGTESTLWLHELATGAERQIWNGLDRDQIEAFATNNVYPGYDWASDNKSLVVWAGGNFKRVPVNGGRPTEIAFTADVSLTYRHPLRSKRDPAPESLRSRLIRWPSFSPDGKTMVFVAVGHAYYMSVPDGQPQRITDIEDLEFAPTFSPDGSQLLLTTWSDADGASLKSVSIRRGQPGAVRTLYESRTQLANPAWSANGSKILVVAGSGANLRGQDLGSEQHHDILIMKSDGSSAPVVVTSSSNRGAQRRITRPTFSSDGTRIWYFDDEATNGERGERTPAKTALLSVKLDGTDRKTHIRFRYAQEVVVSPDESYVAFTEQHNAYVMPLPRTGGVVDFDPNGAATAFQQLSTGGGGWVTWSADNKYLSWGFGEKVTRLPVDEISMASEAEPRDSGDAGIEVVAVAITSNGQYQFGDLSHDLESLKPLLAASWQDASHARVDLEIADEAPWSSWTSLSDWLDESKIQVKKISSESDEEETDSESDRQEVVINLEVPRTKPAGMTAFTGARIITMNGNEVIENGTVVVDGNRIVDVGESGSVSIPDDAQQFDASGKTIMPGLIDVHAHMGYSVLDINPQRERAYYANLAYGVTTTHDPSASTDIVFSQSEMVEAGVMVGPRIFSTGFILYGALTPDMAVINSYADARFHVRRLKDLGAFSVKSYQQPRRDQRQWIIRAAAAEDMLVVPEGGGDFPDNIGMVLDGHSGIEHSLSVGQIYNDVVQLFARTRAGYTATLLVSYGGQEGEKWFYQHYDVWKNKKLQMYFPPRSIDARSRRRVMSAEDDYNHKRVAHGLKKISDAGGLVTLGAHGQLQGLGAHWELWALTHGGMSPHDALTAATRNGAVYLGMDDHLGSIQTGKLADFIVLDSNPLDDIRNSESVEMTISNGVVYDSDNMNQLWPQSVERGPFPFE